MLRRACVDESLRGEVPGADRVVPRDGVRNRGVLGVKGDGGDGGSVAREEAERAVAWGSGSGDNGSRGGDFPLLGLRREDVGRCRGALAGLCTPETDGRVGGGREDPVGSRVHGNVLEGGFVAEELSDGGDDVVRVRPETQGAVHGRGYELRAVEPFHGLDGGAVAGGFGEDLAAQVPDPGNAIIGSGQDPGEGAVPVADRGRDRRDPVVVLEGGLEFRRDHSTHVFQGNDTLGRQAIGLQVGVETRAQEGTAGEEVEGDGCGGVKEMVDDLRQTVAFEV